MQGGRAVEQWLLPRYMCLGGRVSGAKRFPGHVRKILCDPMTALQR